jgi:hypothetical protein
LRSPVPSGSRAERIPSLVPRPAGWEPVALLQRLAVTGFVLLVEHEFLRVVTAILVSIIYFVMFLLASPYEDEQADMMSSACQFCLFAMYMCIALIKLRQELTDRVSTSAIYEIIAITSVNQIAAVMIILILLALSPVIILVIVQIRTERAIPKMLLVSSRRRARPCPHSLARSPQGRRAGCMSRNGRRRS